MQRNICIMLLFAWIIFGYAEIQKPMSGCIFGKTERAHRKKKSVGFQPNY